MVIWILLGTKDFLRICLLYSMCSNPHRPISGEESVIIRAEVHILRPIRSKIPFGWPLCARSTNISKLVQKVSSTSWTFLPLQKFLLNDWRNCLSKTGSLWLSRPVAAWLLGRTGAWVLEVLCWDDLLGVVEFVAVWLVGHGERTAVVDLFRSLWRNYSWRQLCLGIRGCGNARPCANSLDSNLFRTDSWIGLWARLVLLKSNCFNVLWIIDNVVVDIVIIYDIGYLGRSFWNICWCHSSLIRWNSRLTLARRRFRARLSAAFLWRSRLLCCVV